MQRRSDLVIVEREQTEREQAHQIAQQEQAHKVALDTEMQHAVITLPRLHISYNHMAYNDRKGICRFMIVVLYRSMPELVPLRSITKRRGQSATP